MRWVNAADRFHGARGRALHRQYLSDDRFGRLAGLHRQRFDLRRHHRKAALDDVAGAATQTSMSAEVVLDASRSVEAAIADLRGHVEAFLAGVAA
jgi:hypothetical protein